MIYNLQTQGLNCLGIIVANLTLSIPSQAYSQSSLPEIKKLHLSYHFPKSSRLPNSSKFVKKMPLKYPFILKWNKKSNFQGEKAKIGWASDKSKTRTNTSINWHTWLLVKNGDLCVRRSIKPAKFRQIFFNWTSQRILSQKY